MSIIGTRPIFDFRNESDVLSFTIVQGTQLSQELLVWVVNVKDITDFEEVVRLDKEISQTEHWARHQRFCLNSISV